MKSGFHASRALYTSMFAGLVVVGGLALAEQSTWVRLVSGAPRAQSTSSAILHVEPAPDGGWIAIERIVDGRPSSHVAVLSAASGDVRRIEIPDAECAPTAWSSEGLLRVRARAEGEVHWIDPRTFATTKTTPDRNWRAQGLARAPGDGWSDRCRGETSTRESDGRARVRIAWPARGLACDVEPQSFQRVQTSRRPGFVFQELRGDDAKLIVRHDLERGSMDTIATIAQNDWSTLSNDGSRLVLNERDRVRVIAADDGRDVARLPAARCATWLEGSHEQLLLLRDRRWIVHDLTSDRDVDVGDNSKPRNVHALADGRLVVCDGERVRILSADGSIEHELRPFND